MSEITINGDQYTIGKLNAKNQLHVFRRVAPLMTGLGEGMKSLSPELADKKMDEIDVSELIKLFSPLIKVLSGMADEQVDYIIDKCMVKVQIRVPDGRWVSVMPAPGRFLYEDKITMQAMLQLTVAVMQESGVLSFFTDNPLSTSPPAI